MSRGVLLLLVLAGIGLSSPAPGQTLRDRIEAVRRDHTATPRPLDPKLVVLQRLLYQKVDARFEEAPLEEVMTFLGTALDIKITFRSLNDAAGHGLDPEWPITLTAEGQTGLAVLEEVLAQCADFAPSTWQLRRDGIEVGTKERLATIDAREVRVYPVEALLFEPPNHYDSPPMGFEITDPGWFDPYGVGYSGSFGGSGTPVIASGTSSAPDPGERERAEELIDLIVGIVEPDAWAQNGGTWASIQYIEGVLVVRAPDFVHRQLGGYPRVPPPRRRVRP